ncbi:glycerate kinase [Paenibacillus sp. OV219]|uniref:glycerate kinase type-2 family protein n=1 Tax=Paenibacillus sp. OV219 TaxID=1884377 RepID=UPI0008D54BD9|nr:glycerate kinase [Paenibacillus sp. OV219]SEO12590.1 hydroxypyruvate reductase [Paenibacillus sp. OV219]
MNALREQALRIIEGSIKAVLPEAAVIKALHDRPAARQAVVVAIGKAAWNMAHAAEQVLGDSIRQGIVITKYEHSKGLIDRFEIIEAGHPIPDENSILGTTKVLQLVDGLSAEEEVIFLISGGGSALFEKPLGNLTLQDLMEVTERLLFSGADIALVNVVRKHLSAVKGGRFAKLCEPASIFAIVLSDVVGDRLDAIASGPACADRSTSEEALDIVKRYRLDFGPTILEALRQETPKQIDNCETVVTGSVKYLCEAAAVEAERLGYQPHILASTLTGEAREVGKMMAAIGREIAGGGSAFGFRKPCAIIAGGETVVKVTGNGKGGRNQEAALAAAFELDGMDDILLFSFGSDGTDGPTDAAGGIIDGGTIARMKASGIDPLQHLTNNDAYYALQASGDLIMIGATGTNVNDVIVLLCK